MTGNHLQQEKFNWRVGKRLLLTWALLGVFLITLGAGCSLMPQTIRRLPEKIRLKSSEAELRAKVEADKFPSAAEAGIY